MGNRLTANLEAIAERIRRSFSAKDKAREQALGLSREVIRFCSTSIRELHRQEYDAARSDLDTARRLLDQLEAALTDFPDLLSTGYVQDAQKEFAEGRITLALVTGTDLPDPETLRVSNPAYLNGMGDAVGELRRYILDSIRRSDFARCEEVLAAMDDMYGIMVTMDFPDAITGGLRRTTDMVRGVLERTRGDLTVAFQQQGLEKRLATLEEHLQKQ